MKFSVIIPVYNCEAYLKSCIDSVLTQNCEDFEVVVVNDGSSDSSAEIASSFSAQDSRVKYLSQQNGGVNSARLTGIKESKGEWICFLDSDDSLPSDALEQYAALVTEDADIVLSGAGKEYDRNSYIADLLRLRVRPELWGKAFRASFLKSHWPALERSIVMGEDLMQNIVLGLNARQIRSFGRLLYNINLSNAGSVTKSFKHSFAYETSYFAKLKDVAGDWMGLLSEGGDVEAALCWSKLNGMKQAVLDGGAIDTSSEYWQEIEHYYMNSRLGLGPSEKLFLKMVEHPALYRSIMKLYLLCTTHSS